MSSSNMLSRLLAMQTQLDACFREACFEALERIDLERPLGMHAVIDSDSDEWDALTATCYFLYPERIKITRLTVQS